MKPALTVPQTVALYRGRYPDALVCTACGRLLATERPRYSRLTDAQAAAYTCAECRWDAVEAARANAARCANLAAARAARRDTGDVLRDPPSEALKDEHLHDSKVSTAAPLAGHQKRGGRVALSPDAKKRGRRETQRRWRAAQATAPVAA